MDVDAFLREARKAQLQEFFLHWFPGEEMVGSRDRLMERLTAAMSDPQKVRARFDRLGRSARDFLGALLSREGYSGTLAEVRAERRSRAIEDFEVESLLRSLTAEGLMAAENQPGPDGGWREVLRIPREIGDALRRTVDLEEREVSKMLSLRDLLAGTGESLDELARPEGLRARLESLPDPALAGLVRRALEDFGGILTRSRHQSLPDLGKSAEAGTNGFRLHRPQWREALERARLGTTGVISLRDFGIDLEEEGLLVFQELVLQAALEEAGKPVAGNDRELSLGADLLVDMERVLEIVHLENVEVTREGAIYKKTEERIGPQLATARHREILEGDPVEQVFLLLRRLNFFEQDGSRLRCDPIRRRAWSQKRPLAKVRELYHLLQAESRGERWSFHQAEIRDVFIHLLLMRPAGSWQRARSLFDATLATYLLGLKDRGVDQEFRRRWNGDFQNEKLMVPLDKLAHDLSYWVLHRLALIGLVDLGYREGKFESIRLSTLGGQLFGQPGPEEAGSTRLIVNPDFEILLFPGGGREAELNLALSRFADRVDSDRVKRYQLTAESVKRGVIAGMDLAAMLALLETNSQSPLPPNVRYSIREWGEGVEPIQKQRMLLLRARSRKGADRLAALLEAHDVTCERFGEDGLLVQVARGERALRDLREALRDQGLYLE